MLWVFIIVVLILSIVFSLPKVKGFLGEKSVQVYLSGLDKTKYRLLNNVLLPNPSGNTPTTQIDHVLVSVYGIFVIETKNWSGWIFGDEYSKNWTQQLNKHTSYQKANPIRQNFVHVEAIRTVLEDYPQMPLIPIIAFTNKAELKKVPEKTHVVNTNRLASTIRKYNTPLLSIQDVQTICSLIENANIQDRQTSKQHVAQIQIAKARKETAVSQGICPSCGGQLVHRNGRYGKFYGCSNYPKCKFTEQKSE